jgi:Fic/DOC family
MHPVIELRRLEGRAREIVNLLASAGEMSQAEVRRRISHRVGQATLSRDLTALADKGIVVKRGVTKGAVFALSAEAARFSRPPHLRPATPYDPGRIGSYRANVTRWLPAAAEERMRDAAVAVDQRLDASTYSRQIAERFLIDLSWASSSLEGNTYGYLETEALIRYGSEAEGHDVMEATMILNHKRAIMVLLEALDKPMLDPTGIARLHALLMRGLLSGEDLGRVRAGHVDIGGSAYKPADDHAQLASDFGALLWQVERVDNPFEASFVLLAGLSYLQPFADGNKRIGRLSCNIPLLKAGLPPMSFVGVDKADYLTGLIVFYETGDLGLLAEVVSKGYASAAPSYAAALATRRQPRSVELHERERIEEAVRAIVERRLAGNAEDKTQETVAARFAHLSAEDRAVVAESVVDALASLNEVNSLAWGVAPEAGRRYAQLRDETASPRL